MISNSGWLSLSSWQDIHPRCHQGCKLYSLETWTCSAARISLHFTGGIRAGLQDDFPLRGQAGHGALLKEPNLRFIWEASVFSIRTQAGKLTKTYQNYVWLRKFKRHHKANTKVADTPPHSHKLGISAQRPELVAEYIFSYCTGCESFRHRK